MPDLTDPARLSDLVHCLRHDATHARSRADLADEAADALEAMEAVHLTSYRAVAERAVMRLSLVNDATGKADTVIVTVARLWPWWRRVRFAVALLSPWWPPR